MGTWTNNFLRISFLIESTIVRILIIITVSWGSLVESVEYCRLLSYINNILFANTSLSIPIAIASTSWISNSRYTCQTVIQISTLTDYFWNNRCLRTRVYWNHLWIWIVNTLAAIPNSVSRAVSITWRSNASSSNIQLVLFTWWGFNCRIRDTDVSVKGLACSTNYRFLLWTTGCSIPQKAVSAS